MFKDPYCSVDEADTVNTSTDWVSLSSTEKETALKWARLYLDGNYDCSSANESDADFVTARKLANALLARQHVISDLFADVNPDDAVLIEKTIKAGSVDIGKKYQTESRTHDRHSEITAALANYCERVATAFKIRHVVR